jgi:methionyl-tRNA synthetase
MNSKKKYMITSALPYANGELHLGHLAGAYLPADIYVRYLRGLKRDVVWVSGSDEHGAAITIRAKKEGISPRQIIDKYHELNKISFERLGISFDIYHRTSEKLHHETAAEFFLKLSKMEDELEEKQVEQYYDQKFNQFLADRYIIGTCPKCQFDGAFGDQCEKCGSDLSPTELIHPKSTLSGDTPVLKATKHWYFNLAKHESWLRDWIENGILNGKPHHDPKLWKKHVTGQCLSWLDQGLQSRAITRDLDWGIPVPLADAEGKVLYVWFDAPIGYISATKQWAEDHGKNWEDFWKGEDVELIHFIGKDNIVFHCIVFPAMLKAYGEYALPKNVPANQFLNFEGEKFSKSRGWGIEMHEYLEEFASFPNKEDALRYALIRNLPENKDSDFKWDEFVDFHDKELADNLGNFVNRVLVLTNNYFKGIVPNAIMDKTIQQKIENLVAEYSREMEKFNFRQTLQIFMEISSTGNVYLQESAPWALAKTNPEDPKIGECLFTAIQIVGVLSSLIEPFLPFTAKKLQSLFNYSVTLEETLRKINNIPSGHQIGQPEVLFPKIVNRTDSRWMDLIQKQKQKLKPNMADPIEYEDFAKIDLRTGTILSASKVEKADKLLQLEIDLGFEKRTIVSGIAEHYAPENIVGQQVVVVANLKPRKLRGIDSQGMILMAENESGKLVFVSPVKGFENGSTVR